MAVHLKFICKHIKSIVTGDSWIAQESRGLSKAIPGVISQKTMTTAFFSP